MTVDEFARLVQARHGASDRVSYGSLSVWVIVLLAARLVLLYDSCSRGLPPIEEVADRARNPGLLDVRARLWRRAARRLAGGGSLDAATLEAVLEAAGSVSGREAAALAAELRRTAAKEGISL